MIKLVYFVSWQGVSKLCIQYCVCPIFGLEQQYELSVGLLVSWKVDSFLFLPFWSHRTFHTESKCSGSGLRGQNINHQLAISSQPVSSEVGSLPFLLWSIHERSQWSLYQTWTIPPSEPGLPLLPLGSWRGWKERTVSLLIPFLCPSVSISVIGAWQDTIPRKPPWISYPTLLIKPLPQAQSNHRFFLPAG